MKNQKLELTGLARTRRLRFELRILLKNPVCRCHAKQRVMGATVDVYGGLQGIAEKSLREIKGVVLKNELLEQTIN